MDPRTFLETIAFSVLIAVVLVTGRLLWCFVMAMHERRYRILIISAAGIIGIMFALSAVVIVWFGYGVAHTGKNADTDLIVLFSTVPPFFLVSLGLWLLGGKLHSRLQSHSDSQQDSKDGRSSSVP